MHEYRSAARWLYLPAALTLPFVLEASLIVITRELVAVPDSFDWFEVAGSLALGVYCLWRVPVDWQARAALTVLYVLPVGFLLFLFGLAFVGSRYGLSL